MLAHDVVAARRFNRFYTQRIGVLEEGLLDSPFSLTEVRVMYELAHGRGVAASTLGRALGLDKGYLSRILKRFRTKGWVARASDDEDARRHVLALTASGRRAFAPLDRKAQRQMRTMLAPLATPERRRVLDAMHAIERALGETDRGPVRLRAHRPGDIGWVVQRHGELYAQEYGWNEEFEALVAEIAAHFVRDLDASRERCWIAERDGVRLGCIFVVAADRQTAKLRLLLVEPEARGIGLGKRLIDECIAFARAVGYRRMVLWTQSNLDAARHLYERAGFRRTKQEAHRSFGKDLIAETWSLKL